jgi:hypothetical protein
LRALSESPWPILDGVEFFKPQENWWGHRTRNIIYARA